ncbi:MAG: ABC transporter permease [Pusillimonas sp.]
MTTAQTTEVIDQQHTGSMSVLDLIVTYRQALVLPCLFILALVGFSIGAPGFFTLDNLLNVARQSVYLMIVSLGQLVVLIVGGLDLSVGVIAALTSVVSALVMAALYAAFPEAPWMVVILGILVGVTIGATVGLVNGFGSAILRIPPFMMTLGMSSVIFGLTLFISGGVPIYGIPPEFGEAFGFGHLFGIPVPTIVAILLILAVYILLEWTRFGRHVYAVGGNVRAAQLSGVRTERVIIKAFIIAGVFAAITGLLLTARLDTGETNIGTSLPLESIAACVIAGVSLAGGTGRTFNVVIGTILIILVQNGLNLMQVGAYASTMTIGAILVFAMALSRK